MNVPTPVSSAPSDLSWEDWHLPLSRGDLTLREAYASLRALGARQAEIPLMVQLVENPRFDIPGFDLFHGAVDLRTHDYIHIVLGRGLLAMDEAFVIGFTMGSTNRVTTLEENLYAFIARHLYPKLYQFNDADIQVFKDATKLGYISDCQPLNQVNYESHLDHPITGIRRELGVEEDLLLAYYRIEKRRHPDSKASQRLLQ